MYPEAQPGTVAQSHSECGSGRLQVIQYTTGAHNHDKEHDNCIIYMCVCIIRYYCVCVRKKIQKELMLK